MAAALDVAPALAVIPAAATPALAQRLRETPQIDVSDRCTPASIRCQSSYLTERIALAIPGHYIRVTKYSAAEHRGRWVAREEHVLVVGIARTASLTNLPTGFGAL